MNTLCPAHIRYVLQTSELYLNSDFNLAKTDMMRCYADDQWSRGR